jgi:hypothetical protein
MEHMERKNYDVRQLSAYQEKKDANPSFGRLLKEIEDRRKHPSRGKYLIIAAIAILMMSGGVFFLWQNASLAISITPKKVTIQPQGEIIALPFEKISVRVPLAGVDIPLVSKHVEEYARGTIVIYNAGTDTHQFVARTRFESPDGKIYRIQKSIAIPGATKKENELTAGSIEAEAVADEPGEASNKEFTDFTVPGLKGSPLFEKFYARSKGAIAGGRVGEEQVVDRKAIEGSAFAERERALSEQLHAQLPNGFLLPQSAWHISYVVENGIPQADITGWIIKRDDLGKKLSSLFFEEEESKRVALFDLANLTISSISEPDALAGENAFLRLVAKGEVVYVERIDKDRLPALIVNLHSANEINAFFESLGSVESATLIFSPSFFERIPADASRITVDVSR